MEQNLRNPEDLNPGEQIQQFFQRIYPFSPSPVEFLEIEEQIQTNFIHAIDSDIEANGELAKLIYYSTINYLVRRFVTASAFIYKKFATDEYPPEQYLQELRTYIENHIRLTSEQRETLFALLLISLSARQKSLGKATKKRIKAQSTKCYICGTELLFDVQGEKNSAEVEHSWPKAMGGTHLDFNLRMVCSSCNANKKTYIDANDYHYEEICLTSDKGDEKFERDLKGEYRVALSIKHNCKCRECNRPASEVGPLEFVRREISDSWHYLNIDAYCSEHIPMM